MAKKKPPQSKTTSAPRQIKKEPPKLDPVLPSETLLAFLEGKIQIKQVNGISKVDAGYLWSSNDVDRFRVNIWKKKDNDSYTQSSCIWRSFFLHYNTKTFVITDKTVPPNLATSRRY